MAAGVAHDLDFMPLLPRRLPVGYHLSRVDLVPFCRTLAILVFRGPRSRQFQITEQLATISFETQFVPGRLPSTRVRLGAKSLTVFHGEFDGTEPIDGLHWHASRRVIAWDEGKVICQLQLRAGESPSVWQGLRMAASVTGLASQNSNQPHD